MILAPVGRGAKGVRTLSEGGDGVKKIVPAPLPVETQPELFLLDMWGEFGILREENADTGRGAVR